MRAATIILSIIFIATTAYGAGWVEKASMSVKRSDVLAVPVNGKIYVAGGCVQDQSVYGDSACGLLTKSVEIYNPEKNTWSNGPAMPIERYRHAAISIGSKIVLISGRDVNDTIIRQTDVLDVEKNTWTQGPQLPDDMITSDGYAFIVGNALYYAGGYYQDYSSSNKVIAWDLTSNSWNTMAPMLTKRGDFGATELGGYVYVFGGFDQDFCSPLKSVEKYNPDTNKWTYVANLTLARGDAAEAAADGRVFVIGGETKDQSCTHSKPITSVESYDPKTGVWSLEASLPDSRMRFAGTSVGGWVYVFGGQKEESAGGVGGDKHVVSREVSALYVGSAATTFTSISVLIFCILSFLFI